MKNKKEGSFIKDIYPTLSDGEKEYYDELDLDETKYSHYRLSEFNEKANEELHRLRFELTNYRLIDQEKGQTVKEPDYESFDYQNGYSNGFHGGIETCRKELEEGLNPFKVKGEKWIKVATENSSHIFTEGSETSKNEFEKLITREAYWMGEPKSEDIFINHVRYTRFIRHLIDKGLIIYPDRIASLEAELKEKKEFIKQENKFYHAAEDKIRELKLELTEARKEIERLKLGE